jgi:hypothetical protein
MLRLMRDGERPRAPELRLRARAPLPATVTRAVIRLFKNTQGSARWRLTRLPARGQTSRRNGVDSPYGKSHRKDPQVAGDWEDDLTILRPQTA